MQSSRRDITKTWGSLTERLRGGLPLGGAWAAVVAVTCLAITWPSVAEVATDQVAGFMRAKLAHSQNVLEGLATEDFDLIERGAQELSLASLDSNWQVLQTEDYVRQSAEFRRACDSLRDAAQRKNLDGATVAWMDVTLKCVQCHKYVRDVE